MVIKYIVIGLAIMTSGIILSIREVRNFQREIKDDKSRVLSLIKFIFYDRGLMGIFIILIGFMFLGSGFKWW